MRNNSKSILLHRYDKFFGKGSADKLLNMQRYLKNRTYIRINLSKVSVEKIESFLKENRVKYGKTFFQNGLRIDKSFFNLSSCLYALSGDIYIQDLASQIPVNMIDFKRLRDLNRKVLILDMAAAPGSKTSQIADLLEYHKTDYHITAIEPVKKRVVKLVNNLQKQGFDKVDVINARAEEFKSNLKFDVILLDAPCSGNMIDDQNWLDKRDLDGIYKMSNLQKMLLEKANKFLAKNGELIYSTCSMEPEEDERNVEFAIKKLSLKTVKSDLNLGFDSNPLKGEEGVENAVRIIPFKSQTQGFFACKLKKS